jgi:hypothetical protein
MDWPDLRPLQLSCLKLEALEIIGETDDVNLTLGPDMVQFAPAV